MDESAISNYFSLLILISRNGDKKKIFYARFFFRSAQIVYIFLFEKISVRFSWILFIGDGYKRIKSVESVGFSGWPMSTATTLYATINRAVEARETLHACIRTFAYSNVAHDVAIMGRIVFTRQSRPTLTIVRLALLLADPIRQSTVH